MSAIKKRLPAQIGMTTVLLSIIMLFIGVSVTWRIVQQAQQELARMESTVALNNAENIVNIEGREDTKDNAMIAGQSAVTLLDPTEDMLYMKKGETITVIVDEDNQNIFLSGNRTSNNTLPTIYYGIGGETPKLLIRRIRSHYDSSCNLTSTEVKQVYAPTTESCTAPCVGDCEMCSNGFDVFTRLNSSALDIQGPRGPRTCRQQEDRIVIMMLEKDSYIGMKGLARHYRAASYSSDNEARVIEQAETDPSAPGLFQFGILVNGGFGYY